MPLTEAKPDASASALRHLICDPEMAFLMEAHNAISARIAGEAGFKALWASSLTISASMGLRDANELTWTESLDLVSAMVDTVDIPVLMDADSGYGDFNILSRFVRKACGRGVAGICIEDKLFPKINSFAPVKQTLADIGEFSHKISAAKDNQTKDDFLVVARTEAFVTGAGMDAALERANAYVDAGADAVLVQSKKSVPDELVAFGNAWDRDVPLIAVPTTYPDVCAETLQNAGVTNIIWANHSMRASIEAMRNVTKALFDQRSSAKISHNIASIEDIFELTDMKDLLVAGEEQRAGQQDD